MNVPSLPTDNLYKFMAISGAALAIIAVVLPYNQLEKECQATNQFMISSIDRRNGMWMEQDRFREEAIKNADVAIKLLSDGDMTESKQKLLTIRSELFASQKDSVNARIDLLSERADEDSHELNRRFESLKELNSQMRWIGLFGVVISVNGFSFWYRRIQKFHDRQIKAEAEQAEKDLAGPPEPPKWYIEDSVKP